MKYLNNRGDTIIEVLLALLIISTVLTGAYVTTRRSLNNGRQAEERSESLKYVQSQVEQVKANVDQAKLQSANFCFANDGSGITNTLSKCSFGSIPGGYRIAIQPPTASGKYVFTAVWDNATATGQDNIKISYQIAP